jgi:hypothetical integral membrane protein (TIGR02206 family)
MRTLQVIHGGFELFGAQHLWAVAAILLVSAVLPLAVRPLSVGTRTRLGYGLALLLIAQEWAQVHGMVRLYGWGPYLLPLHLCALSVYLTAWTLATHGQRAYELAYYWAIGGASQALLTPDLTAAFPSPAFLFFFFGHGLVILGVLYATLALGLRPSAGSIPWVLGVTLAVAAGVFAVNLWLGTNFMYLRDKPSQPSVLDWFGPWPEYLPFLVLAGVLSILLSYLPFALLDTVRQRRGSGAAGPRGR